MTKKRKKKSLPSNWLAYKEQPPEFFQAIEFDKFMDWRVTQWELSHPVSCVIRSEDIETGKVKEHVYKRSSAAKLKIKNLLTTGKYNLSICTKDIVHQIDSTFMEDMYDAFTR